MLVVLLVFCPNYAQMMLPFQNIMLEKNRQNSKKGEFYQPFILLLLLPDFVCCFSGLKYPISSTISSFGSLQDLKVLGVCFGDGRRHFVTWSHLWEWD